MKTTDVNEAAKVEAFEAAKSERFTRMKNQDWYPNSLERLCYRYGFADGYDAGHAAAIADLENRMKAEAPTAGMRGAARRSAQTSFGT